MRFLVRFADVDTAMFTCVSVRVNRKFVDVKVMLFETNEWIEDTFLGEC